MSANHWPVGGDMPSMATSAYASTAYSGAQMLGQLGQNWGQRPSLDAISDLSRTLEENPKINPSQKAKVEPMSSTRRIVQVIIMDPNENVPLDKCVLYKGDEKMTDLDNQELFFEVDIKAKLDAYNSERVKVRDKAVKDREQMLEPARIRDLKMVVVEIAKF